MPRKKMPVSIVEARGKKNLTHKEREERKSAEEAIQPSKDKVVAPEWLDEIAKQEWDNVIEDLKEHDIVTNIDVGSLAVCCDAYSQYVQAHKEVAEYGLTVLEETKYGEKRVKNPAVTVQKQYAEIYKQFMSEFGLSPSARLKLVMPKKEEKEPSEFEKKFGDV